MRICDWRSDVCSSDLYPLDRRAVARVHVAGSVVHREDELGAWLHETAVPERAGVGGAVARDHQVAELTRHGRAGPVARAAVDGGERHPFAQRLAEPDGGAPDQALTHLGGGAVRLVRCLLRRRDTGAEPDASSAADSADRAAVE